MPPANYPTTIIRCCVVGPQLSKHLNGGRIWHVSRPVLIFALYMEPLTLFPPHTFTDVTLASQIRKDLEKERKQEQLAEKKAIRKATKARTRRAN